MLLVRSYIPSLKVRALPELEWLRWDRANLMNLISLVKLRAVCSKKEFGLNFHIISVTKR